MVIEWFNLLPEEVEWRDEGCEVYSACLECPLPRCLEEVPRGRQRLKVRLRAARMAELRREGKSVAAIAGLFGVSIRTVQRALKEARPARRPRCSR